MAFPTIRVSNHIAVYLSFKYQFKLYCSSENKVCCVVHIEIKYTMGSNPIQGPWIQCTKKKHYKKKTIMYVSLMVSMSDS